MKLEAQTLAKIKSRINEKVMGCCGTWIDWQYLLDAAALLAKCRYTLQVSSSKFKIEKSFLFMLHSITVHLSICLLHGGISKKRAGESFSFLKG
jgi:hypothetical protein